MSESNNKENLLIIPFDLRRKYELAVTSSTRKVFFKPTTRYYVLNKMRLMKNLGSLEDYEHSNILEVYFDSLRGDYDVASQVLTRRGEITLTGFFSLQMIDIPKPFSRAKSLYSSTAAYPKVRFLNSITQHGKKLKVLNSYSYALAQISDRRYQTIFRQGKLNEWRCIYTSLGNLFILPEFGAYFGPRGDHATKYEDIFSQKNYRLSAHRSIESRIFDAVADYIPIFSFYLKKVDKLKRRHSRGKSGRYTISWKYVPLYRRLLTTLRWLVRDVRTQKAKTFRLRLLRSLETFFFDRETHTIPRLRAFVHTFVFQHHKKNLLKNLKSVS